VFMFHRKKPRVGEIVPSQRTWSFSIHSQTLLTDSHTCLLLVVIKHQWYIKANHLIDEILFNVSICLGEITIKSMLRDLLKCFKECINADVIAKMQLINTMSFGCDS